YSGNYLQKRFGNIFIQFTPNYWEYDNNNDQTSKLETPNKDQETPKDSQQKDDNTKPEPNENEQKDNNTETTGTIGNNETYTIEMEVVRLVNIERQKEGLAPLSYNEELSKVARAKSQDMAQKN